MAELAERCPGLSEDVIQHIESGRPVDGHRTRSITIDELMAVVEALGADHVEMPVGGTMVFTYNHQEGVEQQAMVAKTQAALEYSRQQLDLAEQNLGSAQRDVYSLRAKVREQEELLAQLRIKRI
jgi:hypothetical protein